MFFKKRIGGRLGINHVISSHCNFRRDAALSYTCTKIQSLVEVYAGPRHRHDWLILGPRVPNLLLSVRCSCGKTMARWFRYEIA